MPFSILPTNIGGVSLSGITAPLSSLLVPKQQINNLMYPSDLGNNPAMGHAVIIQAYDYSTQLATTLNDLGILSAGETVINSAINTVEGVFAGNFGSTSINAFRTAGDTLTTGGAVATSAGTLTKSLITASNYKNIRTERPLATISLFMPDTVNIQYNSSYSEVSLTEELGLAGYVGSAMADKNNTKNLAITGMAQLAQAGLGLINRASGIGSARDIGALAAQGAGVVVNPQMQLLFKGVALRTFQLEFMLTPKTSKEAETIKNICDTLTFYSLPGVGGSQLSGAGQFLTPPQIFKIDFKFLGQTGVISNISNVISTALRNSGLNFLSSGTEAVENGQNAKTFSVNECVLENVLIDYAPNGWATYNDGYPVQTSLTLQFKEMEMPTKDSIKNAAVAGNYNIQKDPYKGYNPYDGYQEQFSPYGEQNG